MRASAAAAVLVLVALAAPARAQDQGSFAVDLMTTPGRHFGVGYYVTDRFSLRPSLGFGYSGQYGTTFDLGADMRFELLPGSRLSPYLAGGISYSRSPYLVSSEALSGPTTALTATGLPSTSSNVARYGAGLGLRTRIKYGLSVVAEGRVMNSALRSGSSMGFYGGQVVDPGAHFQGAIGLSYAFN